MTSRSIAQCGLCCALLACSAWVTIPFGPVPFTLQTLAVALVPQVLGRREAVFTVAAYLVLGAIGLPVFSGFQGGIGVLAGLGLPGEQTHTAGEFAYIDELEPRIRLCARLIASLCGGADRATEL